MPREFHFRRATAAAISRPILLATAVAGALAFTSSQAVASPVSCGEVITHDTTLQNDLTNCPRNGIVIGADHITLDLNGHFLSGVDSSRAGVANDKFPGPGYRQVTIENGTIRGFGVGVSLSDANQNRVRGLNIETRQSGILINGDGSGTRIEQNTLWGHGGGNGIDLQGDYNRIENNSLLNNGFAGIRASGAQHNVLKENLVAGQEVGVVLQPGADENEVVANRLLNNTTAGVQAGFFWYGTVEARNNDIERNRATNNGDGIWITQYSEGTLARNNFANTNANDGILIDDPATVVGSNTANGNGNLGIEAVAGVTSLGINRASGNGNPLQCLNVACK